MFKPEVISGGIMDRQPAPTQFTPEHLQVVRSETQALLGRVAVLRNRPQSRTPRLSSPEAEFLVRASYGDEDQQPGVTTSVRKTLIHKFLPTIEDPRHPRHLPRLVYLFFRSGLLSFDREPLSATPELKSSEVLMLNRIAAGHSQRSIGKELHVRPNEWNVRKKILFKKMGATSLSHAMRRSYELGYYAPKNRKP